MSQTRALIQDDLLHGAQRIKAQQAADMKHIANRAQDAAVSPLWNSQPMPCPHHDIGHDTECCVLVELSKEGGMRR